MKISELPKKIKSKALAYQKLDGSHLDSDSLGSAFTWKYTKEGHKYWLHWFNKEVKMKDTIVESVIEQFKQRSEVGIKKYNTTLDRTDLSTQEWLQHLQEELMDATLYIQKLKDIFDKRIRYEK